MIGYLEGRLLKKEADRILLLAGSVGYEVLLPPIVAETLMEKSVGDELNLYIYFQQSERQPRPQLIGFHQELIKDFFQLFITVEDIGPLKAVKALTLPVHEIAKAVESEDVRLLKSLKGIGGRTAQKMIATLKGKMECFLLPTEGGERPLPGGGPAEGIDAICSQVLNVLVEQLGHKPADAAGMIDDALARNPAIASAEALFDEVLSGL